MHQNSLNSSIPIVRFPAPPAQAPDRRHCVDHRSCTGLATLTTCNFTCSFAITNVRTGAPSGPERHASRRCMMALMDSVLGLDPFLADFDRLSQRLLGSVEAVR